MTWKLDTNRNSCQAQGLEPPRTATNWFEWNDFTRFHVIFKGLQDIPGYFRIAYCYQELLLLHLALNCRLRLSFLSLWQELIARPKASNLSAALFASKALLSGQWNKPSSLAVVVTWHLCSQVQNLLIQLNLGPINNTVLSPYITVNIPQYAFHFNIKFSHHYCLERLLKMQHWSSCREAACSAKRGSNAQSLSLLLSVLHWLDSRGTVRAPECVKTTAAGPRVKKINWQAPWSEHWFATRISDIRDQGPACHFQLVSSS